MSEVKRTSTGGLGLCSVLTIIFVVLKLVKVINWSWWLVLLPTLIEAGLVIVVVVIWITYEVYQKNKREKWKS